jgi:hypothetical protein
MADFKARVSGEFSLTQIESAIQFQEGKSFEFLSSSIENDIDNMADFKKLPLGEFPPDLKLTLATDAAPGGFTPLPSMPIQMMVGRTKTNVKVWRRRVNTEEPTGSTPPGGAIVANTPNVADIASNSSKRLGKLSEKFEVGNRGPGTVSTGIGDAGGVSYGSYQMTSRGGGTVGLFVARPEFPFRAEFAGLTPGTDAFTAKWKAIAGAQPRVFQAAQHEFIKRTHFDPFVANIHSNDGLDVTARSHAFQDVIWSTAVQHGPNTSVVHNALATLKSQGTPAMNAVDFDKNAITAIYMERGRKGPGSSLVHFSNNSAAVQQGVARRFVDELHDALQMLADEA